MKQIGTWALIASATFTAGACRRQEPAQTRPERTPRAVMISRFQPPSDGQLSNAQVDRYLRVRRSSKGRSELEAIRAAGVDPDEYTWVRARIIEALLELKNRKVRSASEETYARTIASLRQARQSARERETQRTLDEQIAGLERERASLKQVDAAPISVTLNAKLIAKRQAEIEALSP
jgi:hypothetical protein